jgi:polyferredoxin
MSIMIPREAQDNVSRIARDWNRVLDWTINHNFAFTVIFFSTVAVALGLGLTFIFSFAQ